MSLHVSVVDPYEDKTLNNPNANVIQENTIDENEQGEEGKIFLNILQSWHVKTSSNDCGMTPDGLMAIRGHLAAIGAILWPSRVYYPQRKFSPARILDEECSKL